jgi:Taurine catabolism dioxygenase TauD, TfdA family
MATQQYIPVLIDGSQPMPDGPIVGPAAWKAADHQNSDVWKYRLDAEDLAELNKALQHVKSAGLDIIEITRTDFPLGNFENKLARLRQDLLNGRGFVLLKGLPVTSMSRHDAAILYWGIGLHIGYPVSQNARGQLLGHVVDLGEKSETTPSSTGEKTSVFISTTSRGYNSRERFNYHVDSGDVVGLLCFHPAKSGGESLITSSVAIHNEIMRQRPDLLRVLYEPFWRDRRGKEIPAGARPYYPMPVFCYHEGQFFCPYSPSGIRNAGDGKLYPQLPPLTGVQREAIDLFDKFADDPRFRLSMEMEAGDIQLLNNHVVVHSRTSYEDFPEPERKRHLLRLWLVTPDHHKLPHWHYDRGRGGARGGIYVPGMTEVASLEP